MNSDPPFDPGLQAERTFLSWQRTLLAIAVVFAFSVRVTAAHMGNFAIFTGVSGLGLVSAAYFGAWHRHRRVRTSLRRFATVQAVSAWPLAALAISTVMLALLVFGGVACQCANRAG